MEDLQANRMAGLGVAAKTVMVRPFLNFQVADVDSVFEHGQHGRSRFDLQIKKGYHIIMGTCLPNEVIHDPALVGKDARMDVEIVMTI